MALKGGIKADPQVTLDLYTIRAWQRALQAGQPWPPTATQWANADRGFGTPRGEVTWTDADYFVVTASHCQVMASVVERRPDFRGIENGLDGPHATARGV
eukprot:4727659-Amphidinium_carterae.1